MCRGIKILDRGGLNTIYGYLTSASGWIVLLVIGLTALVRLTAPNWKSVTQDGDLQFMPSDSPSRLALKELDAAFPQNRSRSQLVLVLANEHASLTDGEKIAALDLGRKILHYSAIAEYQRWIAETATASAPETEGNRAAGIENSYESADSGTAEGDAREGDAFRPAADPIANLPFRLSHAIALLDQAIAMDQERFDALLVSGYEDPVLLDDRLAVAFLDRGTLLSQIGSTEQARADLETAELLVPGIADREGDLAKRNLGALSHILETWTWRDSLLGSKLGADQSDARMIVIQLDSDFIAVSNIELLDQIDALVNQVRERHDAIVSSDFKIALSGSAAVGGDMLRAARSSVKQTELVTIVLIIGILVVIYRSPLLVAIPLISIGVALALSVGCIAHLASGNIPGSQLYVFSTTRVFLVVLVFGAGTDYCMFLIARVREGLRESMSRDEFQALVAKSSVSVFAALIGSALTTIVGLGLMVFSAFQKFSHTGFIIAISLSITILICLVLTPALLAWIGPIVFWPTLTNRRKASPRRVGAVIGAEPMRTTAATKLGWFSESIIRYPQVFLAACFVVLVPAAIVGFLYRDSVTYDFPAELSANAPSRTGTELVSTYFGTREASPLTVTAKRAQASSMDEERQLSAVEDLRCRLFLPGVESVRAITDPLGDFPPDRRMGLFDQQAWRRRLLESHYLTRNVYYSDKNREFRTARLDVIGTADPFSNQSMQLLAALREKLDEISNDANSDWYQAEFFVSGTTAGIADLQRVTRSDRQRIQWLVSFGVLCVLVIILRRMKLAVYLVATVLLSYLVTLGFTYLFFNWVYSDDFAGLDWKVPLFLFVILVAIGQDYNVYLTTRILEEQAKHGPIQGLRTAIRNTSSIITNCGLVMAGTFASMTASGVLYWLSCTTNWPVLSAFQDVLILRGVIELGFALSIGVLLDTFVVRSILVPALFAFLTRRGELSATT